MEPLIKYLSGFSTEDRANLFFRLVEKRTRYIKVVLEDVFQSHNISAVLRTCDCFGIQDVHIIEKRNEYKINDEIALGSNKWLSVHRHNSTTEALKQLKKEGYRIVATLPDKKSTSLNHFDLNQGKTALVFGTELEGLSQEAISIADETLYIPMVGFTESFNISVSAAIILSHLVFNLHKSSIPWQLRDKDKNEILLSWFTTSIKDSAAIIKQFNESL